MSDSKKSVTNINQFEDQEVKSKTNFVEPNRDVDFGEMRDSTNSGDKYKDTTKQSNTTNQCIQGDDIKVTRKFLKLNHFAQQPHWLKDNHFLHNNHRAPTESYLICLKSCFTLHTETMNIWTHLLPCFLFIFFIAKTLDSNNLTLTDKMVIGGFLLGALVCHFLSTAFHTFICHSERVGKIFQKLDYLGICVLITMSFLPFLHYGFHEDSFYANTYLAGVITLGLMSIWFSMDDKFGSAAYRPVRAIGFAIFGLFGIIPGVHWILLYSDEFWASLDLKTSFISLITMGVLYILGASLYACRVPERFFPGKCDLFLHSHQIFHVLVTLAALVHYYGINVLVDYVKSVHGMDKSSSVVVVEGSMAAAAAAAAASVVS